MFRSCVCFFFQAEDGIRDLVRSRGLGDVYKRQAQWNEIGFVAHRTIGAGPILGNLRPRRIGREPLAVSYTHLTLPTSDLV